MAKLTNSIYLDYNSTSPLAQKFIEFLSKGNVSFANPSSQHSLGKQSRKEINSVKEEIFSFFKISEKNYNIVFHSGASEWISTIFAFSNHESLFYFSSDHPAVTAKAKHLGAKGHAVTELSVKEDGSVDIKELSNAISGTSKTSWLNLTWVHNESGAILDIGPIAKLKEKHKELHIHVDAVQAIGKLPFELTLDPLVDAYTFSGHKFGALKGIGFSLIKKSIKLNAIIFGGGQQKDIRPGTENLHGITSIKYALEDIKEKVHIKNSLKLRESMERIIEKNSNFIILRPKSRAINTICFMHKTQRADILLAHFDMGELAISSGSACNSGSLVPSQCLVDMGFEQYALNNLRISFGPQSWKESEILLKKLKNIIGKL